MSVAGEVVKAELARFPDTPTRTLSNKIYKENPSLWETVEHCRAMVRYYRGTIGKKNRQRISTHEHFKPNGSCNVFDELPDPLTDYADWCHVVLPNGRWLILADLHVPYYRRDELIAVLKYGLERQVTGIVLLGDIADFYSVSFWQKDPRRRDFSYERESLLTVLDVIRQTFPDIPIFYKLGNHEERLTRYLRVKAPELIGLKLLDFESICKAETFSLQVVGDKRLLKLGRLYLLHGHEFGTTFFSPVNPARGLYLRGKEISLCAHYHQTSQHTEKSMADVITSCWSIGCLSDLHPEYRPLNKWNHGFALVDNEDEFVVRNHKIINKRIY